MGPLACEHGCKDGLKANWTMAKARVLDNGIAAPRGMGLEGMAFEHFPYGMVVLDRDGRIVLRNLQARRLIEATGLPEQDATCCALLGCRAPATVLAEACLTELALARGAVLPEIRVDIKAQDGSVNALWVVAAITSCCSCAPDLRATAAAAPIHTG